MALPIVRRAKRRPRSRGYERRARPVVRRAGSMGTRHPRTLPCVAPQLSASPSAPTRTTFSRTCCIFSSGSLRPGQLKGYPGSCRLSTALSAIRTAAAGVGGFSLLAVLVYVADEYPAFEATARTLQAGVVSLYGVVIGVVGVYPSRVHSL